MSELPDTLAELTAQWQELLSDLGRGNGRRIATQMTRQFAASRHWTEWYQRNTTVAEISNLVMDISWAPSYRIIVYDEPPAWQKIRRLVEELYLKEKSASGNW